MVYIVYGNPQLDSRDSSMYSNIQWLRISIFAIKMIKHKAFRINVGRIDRIMMPHMNLMIVNMKMLIVIVVKHTQKTRFCNYSLMFSRSSGNTTIRLNYEFLCTSKRSYMGSSFFKNYGKQ